MVSAKFARDWLKSYYGSETIRGKKIDNMSDAQAFSIYMRLISKH